MVTIAMIQLMTRATARATMTILKSIINTIDIVTGVTWRTNGPPR
jgi:hypothetical protein